MAWVSVLARRFELGARVICKNIGSFTIGESILAIGDQMLRYALHVVHAAQPTHRILNEEEVRFQLADEVERVDVHHVSSRCFLRLRV